MCRTVPQTQPVRLCAAFAFHLGLGGQFGHWSVPLCSAVGAKRRRGVVSRGSRPGSWGRDRTRAPRPCSCEFPGCTQSISPSWDGSCAAADLHGDACDWSVGFSAPMTPSIGSFSVLPLPPCTLPDVRAVPHVPLQATCGLLRTETVTADSAADSRPRRPLIDVFRFLHDCLSDLVLARHCRAILVPVIDLSRRLPPPPWASPGPVVIKKYATLVVNLYGEKLATKIVLRAASTIAHRRVI